MVSSRYRQQISGTNYSFDGLVDLLAKATPLRSGDELAGCAAGSDSGCFPRDFTSHRRWAA